MKIIIIEGPDNTGKNTLIQNILDNNKVVKLVHCDKPEVEPGDDPFEEQCRTFYIRAYNAVQDKLRKDIDVIVFNRYYQGEYVYGQIYRNGDRKKIKEMITITEEYLLKNFDYDDILYVQLNSSSVSLLKKNDDGKSLSEANMYKMQREIDLFNEVYEYSILKKHKILINDGDNFRTREDILIEFNDFINTGI